MARPKAFDTDAVLDAAQQVFWQKGYEATSVTDLVDATGLHKGSLYNAFGDKRSLFLSTLERYYASGEATLRAHFEATRDDPRGALEQWLQGLAAACRGPDGRMGCYAANSTAELAAQDPEIGKSLQAHHRRLRDLVADVIRDAQSGGQLAPELDAQRLAELMWSVAVGLRVIARRGEAGESSRQQVELLLDLLRSNAAVSSGARPS